MGNGSNKQYRERKKHEKMNISAIQVQAGLMRHIFKRTEKACAEDIGVGKSEISRKVKNESSFTLTQISELLAGMGAYIIYPDDSKIVVDQQELDALNTLAQIGLTRVINESDDGLLRHVSELAKGRLANKTNGQDAGVVYSVKDKVGDS